MNYLTVKETAEKWSLSERQVQQFCKSGRIPGAVKFGNAWRIPLFAAKPEDYRKIKDADIGGFFPALSVFSLYPIQPGSLEEQADSFEDPYLRKEALAECSCLQGDFKKSLKLAQSIPLNSNAGVAALNLKRMAALNSSNEKVYKKASKELTELYYSLKEINPEDRRTQLLKVACDLHSGLDPEQDLPSCWFLQMDMSIMSQEIRLLSILLYCANLYHHNEYELLREIAGLAQMLFGNHSVYTTTEMYLQLMTAAACCRTGEYNIAEQLIDRVMKFAMMDHVFFPVSCFYGCTGTLIERWLEKNAPESKDAVEQLWKMNREVFETGNVNGKRVNTILNLKEYQIASLARGRMNNEEIAEFMDLSVSSVKTYLSTVYTKLNVEGRKQLQTFLI